MATKQYKIVRKVVNATDVSNGYLTIEPGYSIFVRGFFRSGSDNKLYTENTPEIGDLTIPNLKVNENITIQILY